MVHVRERLQKMVRVARYIYTGAAWLFVVGVMLQVFLAGLVVVARQISWKDHVSLGHLLAAPLLFMLVTMYLGRLARREKILTWVLFIVYIFQADVIIFMRVSAPMISAFHPVLALLDFAFGYVLARRALILVSEKKEMGVVLEKLDPSALP